MAETSNSTMEMGTSDQVLVSSKKKKRWTYAIGFLAMLAAIAVVVTIVVVLGGNEGGVAEPIVSTEGPTTPAVTVTSPMTTAPSTTTTTTTTVPTTTEVLTVPPTTEPPEESIELEDVISGVYSTSGFNGSWTSSNDILFRNSDGDLVTYDFATESFTMLVPNNFSEVLQQSSRVTQLSPDSTHVALSYNVVPVYRYSFLARYAVIDLSTAETVDILPPGIPTNEAFLQNFLWGPEGTSCAFVYLNNIYYKANLTSEAQQLSTNGQLNVVYNGIPDWVYEEEVFGSYNAMWFSKDGSRLAYVTFDDSAVKVMKVPHYGVPGSVDYQYTQHHQIRYPKPGTTNPTVSVTLVSLENRQQNIYFAPSTLEQPILKSVKFVTNNRIALIWTNRVQNNLVVEICTENQSGCQQIFEYAEEDGWIDNIPFMFNEEGNAFITILPQPVNGVLYKQIVQISVPPTGQGTLQNRINTNHTVIEILLWTPDNNIWYKATGTTDTAEQHIYKVDSANSVECFTCNIQKTDGSDCLYNDASISPGNGVIIVNCAGPEVPQLLAYYTNGSFIRVWDNNTEVSSLMSTRALPRTIRLSVPLGEGLPDADVKIQVPDNYESRDDVPLLVYVYGGPDTALVTKQWSIDWGTSLVNRWGIAVAHIDGRGSGLRGVANMFAVNRKLGSVEIEDQINVTRYLQSTLPWLDANRTCIWGWSYGGYAASLSLARGHVFRCAAAVAPVVDWRFYDTIYTERYMDVPSNNTLGYAQSSLLTEETVEAFRSKRYFLVHGTADDNVHYQHAMLLSRLLQRSDVYFNQMSYTDEDHGLIGVTPHLYHALEKFLEDNML